MDERLRHAWTKLIKSEDLDAHMAAVGQAQANAELVAELFESHPPSPGASILFVGAGTGQLLDYVSPAVLRPFRTTFADINLEFLARLRSRIGSERELKFDTVLDDVENSQLSSGYALVVAILVLEHVDWRKAVATLCRLSSERVFVVLQENPAGLASALTMDRPIVGSMSVFQAVHPHLLSQSDVAHEFREHGFALVRSSSRDVLDSKKMIALEFEKRP